MEDNVRKKKKVGEGKVRAGKGAEREKERERERFLNQRLIQDPRCLINSNLFLL